MLLAQPPQKLHPAYAAVIGLVEQRYLTPEQVAERWQWSTQHLANLRRSLKGPAYLKLANRSVRYPLTAVLAYELEASSGHVTRDKLRLAVLASGVSADTADKIESLLYGKG